MGANVLNFVFNAVLGRSISFEQLGIISFIGTLFYVCSVFYNSLSFIVNRQTAILDTTRQSEAFSNFVVKRLLLFNSLLFVLWILFSPFIAHAFHISNIVIVLIFAFILLLYPLNFIYRGYFQGKFFFYSCAFVIVFEPVVKLILAALFILRRNEDLTFLSLYISALITVVVTFALYLLRRPAPARKIGKRFTFPTKLFTSAIASSLSSIPFLALDLILVKHYLAPQEAGQYALLTLVGKIIYFSGSLLSIFIVSLVGRDEANKKNPLISFYKILAGSIVAGGSAYVALGIFGPFIAPLLFGRKAFALVPYLNTYCLAMLLFTLGTSIISFHLAKKQYIFPISALAVSVLTVVGILLFHRDIREIVNTLLSISILSSLLLFVLHIKKRNQSSPVLYQKVLETEEFYG